MKGYYIEGSRVKYWKTSFNGRFSIWTCMSTVNPGYNEYQNRTAKLELERDIGYPDKKYRWEGPG
jgi:hypothetical protein